VNAGELDALRRLLGDSNFSGFAELRRLETLDSGPFMAMTPQAIEVISKLPSLKHLRIQQSQLLDQRRQAPHLLTLSTHLPRRSLRLISNIPGLIELHLYKVQFVDSFAALGDMKDVISLCLRGCFLRDIDLVALSNIPNLERLNIRFG
jgi:hypothetical protein